jgi:predicted  nucleic acid-binding Zn-ribbon protein
MSVPQQLLRLEEIDTEIEQLEHRRQSIQRRTQENPDLTRMRRSDGALRSREHGVAAELRALETALTDIQARLDRDQRRMYGGQIVDARELASLQREIDHHTLEKTETEDRILSVMEQLETLEDEVARSRNALREMEALREAELPELSREDEAISEALTRLRADRDQAMGSLDAKTLALYQRLRASLGHAVVIIAGGVCGGCRVVLPPRDTQHVWGGALVQCANCSRILAPGT